MTLVVVLLSLDHNSLNGKVTLIAVFFRRHGRDDLLSIRSSMSNPDSILAVMKLQINVLDCLHTMQC